MLMALVLFLRFRIYGTFRFSGSNAYEVAAFLGAALLLTSSIRLFMGSRLGDPIALAGALMIWPLFRIVEFNGSSFSSWLTFNLSDAGQYREALFVAWLTILSIGLLSAVTVFSALRSFPSSRLAGRVAVRDRFWPALLTAFLFVAVWYASSVSPYRIPIYDITRGPRYLVALVHFEKHGLRVKETTFFFYRDGKFYSGQDRRRLFEYTFNKDQITGVLTEEGFAHLRRIVSDSQFERASMATAFPPHNWSVDQWFVSVQQERGGKDLHLVFDVLPTALVDLTEDTKKVPQEQRETQVRDVCLGFCYDSGYSPSY